MIQLVLGATPPGSPSSNQQLCVGVGILPAIALMVIAFAGATSWSGLKATIPHNGRRAADRRR